jgi:hypothetical protein
MEASEEGGSTVATPTDDRFRPGIEDAIIVPLAAGALAAAKVARALLTALIRILDYAFPILLQVMRFPLFTARIIGDGLVWLSKGIIACLPLGFARRRRWIERVSAGWSWLRRKISYTAFEEAVHHLFEGGMAWMFRRCRTLTPRAAVLVIVCAALWLPISFSIATAMHALLLAYAASLPPWMQLLHPFATLIAKSKLLVLPVYPASWPQAKRHPLVGALFDLGRYTAGLHLVCKTRYRYRQADRVAGALTAAVERSTAFAVLGRWWHRVSLVLRAAMAGLAGLSRIAAARVVGGLRAMPLVGAAVGRYEAHYDRVAERPPLSERMHEVFARWSIKFSAQYYEAKDREEGVTRPG